MREFISSDDKNSVTKLKKMLFACDARLYRKALEALMFSEFRFDGNDISKGRRYYVMSRMLTEGVNEILRDHNSLG